MDSVALSPCMTTVMLLHAIVCLFHARIAAFFKNSYCYADISSRFIVKQTDGKLLPKSTFIPHEPVHKTGHPSTIDMPIHGPATIPYGWEWLEMNFLVHWTAPGSSTILCFNVPDRMKEFIQLALISGIDRLDLANPYSIFGVVIDGLITL